VATRTVIRAGALALVAGTVAALAAACGGGGSSGAKPAPSATGIQAELAAYVNCLNQNGVSITLPSGAGNFPSGRPTGFPGRSGFPTNRPTNRPTDRPDGRPSGSFGPGGFGGGFGGGFLRKPANVDQATWDKAVTACASVRPSFAGGGRGGGDNGANAAYQNCLRDHGMTAGSRPSAAALQACEVLKPTGAPSSSS
jgi:hypothetical protein